VQEPEEEGDNVPAIAAGVVIALLVVIVATVVIAILVVYFV